MYGLPEEGVLTCRAGPVMRTMKFKWRSRATQFVYMNVTVFAEIPLPPEGNHSLGFLSWFNFLSVFS